MSEAAFDELFVGPLESFVKRRDALAAERKRNGDRPGAAAVKAIVKPTVSAHGVNRLWVSRRADFDALLAAGEALRNAVRQGGGDALREAQKRQRGLVTNLRDMTAELLVAEGHAANAGTLERIARTLGAISTRGSFAPGAPGRLSTDLEPPGLDELIDVVALPPDAPPVAASAPIVRPPAPKPEPSPPSAPGPTDEEKREQAEKAARAAMLTTLADAVRVADEERDRSRVVLERSVAAREAAEREVNELRARLDAAEKAFAQANALVDRETRAFAEKNAQSDAARARLEALRRGK